MVRPFNPMMLNNARPAAPTVKKKEKGPKKTTREKILIYTKLFLASVLVGGLTSLMFLGLLVVDPALSTISAHFVERPVSCKVILSEYILGM